MKRYVLPCVVCREGGGLCPGGWSTRLWPLLHLDGRSNGPGSINRLVTPSTWTKLCILFFWIIFRKYWFTHIVKNGIVRNAEVNGSTEKFEPLFHRGSSSDMKLTLIEKLFCSSVPSLEFLIVSDGATRNSSITRVGIPW